MKKKLDKIRLAYYSLAAFIVLLFLYFSYARVFDEFEYSTLDFRYSVRPPLKTEDDIVIVEVGDDSIEKIGKWPFPRSYHSLLVNALKASGAKVIVFDIFFSEHKEGDDELAVSAKEAGNVYMPYIFELDRDHPDPRMIRATGYAAPLIDELKVAAKDVGFINVKPDVDGKVRKIPPFIEYGGEYYPHMTFLVALNELGYRWDQVEIEPGKRIVANNKFVIPIEDDSSMLVNYPDVWGKAFRHYSYVDILQSYLADVTGQEPILDLKEMKGAVCFIGLTATASPDAHPSPMEPLYPGIGVHTSLYNSVVNGKFLVRLGRWWNLLIVVLLAVVTAVITYLGRKRIAALALAVSMLLYFVFSLVMFWPFGIWVDLFYPLVAMAVVYVVVTFVKYINEIKKREILEKELNIARDIQQSFLPVEMPGIGGFEVDVRMITALQVGGDLYDVLDLGDGKLAVMLGDVSGKGVPAALFMAKAVSIFKAVADEGSTSGTMKLLNRRLAAESRSNLFVTLAYLIFDSVEGKVQYSSGGHLPTMVIRPDGEVLLLDVEEGIPLGLMDGDYGQDEYSFEPGTLFILYTDGVTEAMNPEEEMFGQERLVELGKKLKGYTPKEAVETIHQAVAEFAGKAKQHDDITVMAIRT
ncbi:MAG: CHASE2 domain-containing protein [Candidatus Omnitrophica bacterium]|nr:CHASE2 domain-containing protein [Candidatus Omnitrophota bacterium]